MDGARVTLEKASPVRFEQAMRMIRGFHSRRQIVVLGLHRGSGLSVAGEVLPRLPGSIQSVWSAAASRSATPLALNVAQEHTEWLEVPLQGSVRIDLEVKRRTPVSATDAEVTDGSEAEPGEGEAGAEAEVESDGDAGDDSTASGSSEGTSDEESEGRKS